MSANNGGQAFPKVLVFTNRDGEVCSAVEDGMTLRDYFAAKSLNVIPDHFAPSPHSKSKDWAEWVAKNAYAVADAMLAAREAISE